MRSTHQLSWSFWPNFNFQYSILNFKYRALHISYSIAPLFWVSKIVFTKVSPNWTARSNESFSINFSIQINTVWTFWRKLNRRTWINISQYHLPPLPQSYKQNKSDTIYKAKSVPEADLIWKNFTKQKRFQKPTLNLKKLYEAKAVPKAN